MRRTNTFDVVPTTEADEELLLRLLDVSAALWNEINYERRGLYYSSEGDLWSTSDYRDRYSPLIGAVAVDQIDRLNQETWRSYLSLKRKGCDATPPGYWGNRRDGRELRTYVRNDSYTIAWGEYSRLEIPVGRELKREHGMGYNERLRLEIRGCTRWREYCKQGRLMIHYDPKNGKFRAAQPVTIDSGPLDVPSGGEAATVDLGANNLVACTTTGGRQYLYRGQDAFDRFRQTTLEIARLESMLPEGHRTSHRIRRLYARRARRQSHLRAALARDLLERLDSEGVSTVFVGDLIGVLQTHWSAAVNEKTHRFWAFRSFIERSQLTAEEYRMSVEVRSEAWTSQTCPRCRSREQTTRWGSSLTCQCGFEGHADLTASEILLDRESNIARPMARPVCLKWDDHCWSESSYSHRLDEERTNPKVASAGVR